MNNFYALGVSEELIAQLSTQHITKPTQIQALTIPKILDHTDLIVKAQTGSGKTLAFLLPIMQQLDPMIKDVQALIVAPTRELALQITQEAKKLNTSEQFGILPVYGGQDIAAQLKKLSGKVQLIIATPGRLLDHLGRGTISLNKVNTFVLDEADQMLQFGFKNDLELIFKHVKSRKQTLCFSATLDSKVKKLAYRYMKDAEEVSLEEDRVPLHLIRQKAILSSPRWKQDALLSELDRTNPFLGIIFCRTKRRADKLELEMSQKKYHCNKLHGGMTQRAREHVMRSFREARFQYLIATDVAARGLDVSNITHVYNYDMPESVEGYIHRIGRTGRLDQKGMAISFATPEDTQILAEIEEAVGITLPKSEHHPKSKGPAKETTKNKRSKSR